MASSARNVAFVSRFAHNVTRASVASCEKQLIASKHHYQACYEGLRVWFSHYFSGYSKATLAAKTIKRVYAVLRRLASIICHLFCYPTFGTGAILATAARW